MKVYISGKITGLSLEEARVKFDEAQRRLHDTETIHPINPMEHVAFNPEWQWHDYMKADIKLLCDCQGIFMLDNWKDSKGAKVEHALAKKLGMKVFYHDTHMLF